MLPGGKLRARNEDDRRLRRDSLILAAGAAIDERPYDAVTMSDIAGAAGLTKASAYLYFITKEELFLALTADELSRWFDALERGLGRLRSDRVDTVARLIARLLAQSPRLLALLALLHGRLEANASKQSVRAFKLFLAASSARAGEALDRRLGSSPGVGAQLLVRTHALAIGMSQMAAPQTAVVAALLAEEPALQAFQLDFEAAIGDALADMLRGRLTKRVSGS